MACEWARRAGVVVTTVVVVDGGKVLWVPPLLLPLRLPLRLPLCHPQFVVFLLLVIVVAGVGAVDRLVALPSPVADECLAPIHGLYCRH